MERRPKTLKDFLNENSSSSCSSSGFIKSLPRRIKPLNDTTSTIISTHATPNSSSTFGTLVNTMMRSILGAKKTSLPSMILPRGMSRRMRSQTFCKGGSEEVKASTVKIKDIMRWKSFGDINVEERRDRTPLISLPPLDFPPQSHPLNFHGCAVGSTTTTTTTTCSSNGSSWSDSDFSTSEYLSSWEAKNDIVELSEKFPLSPNVVVGKDLVEPTTKTAGSKGISTCEEDEQHSPVSVLQVGEDEFSPFDQSLVDIKREKQKFMHSTLAKFDIPKLDHQCLLLDENSSYDEDDDDEKVEEQDYVEERARQLLHCLKATCSIEYYLDTLLLDFFREELIGVMRRNQATRNYDEKECELEILRIAKNWIEGSFGYDDIGFVNKDACIKNMDMRGGWSKFEEEKEELALEIEMDILHSLVNEALDMEC